MSNFFKQTETSTKEIRTFNVDGVELKFQDIIGSETLKWVVKEALIEDEYGSKKINFNDNDIVLDIGANIGCVSIFLAKKFPNIKIYAFEAHPINYDSLLHNIEINGVKNIIPINKAVYNKTGETLSISLDENNTGASSCFVVRGEKVANIETISLDDILTSYNITEIKFLKIDCEGAEFDIIEDSKILSTIKIDTLGMEVHGFMRNQGKDLEAFYKKIDELNIQNKNIRQLG